MEFYFYIIQVKEMIQMIEGVYLVFALGFIFCLSIWLSSLTVKRTEGVLLWIMILSAIFVYVGLFDLWILILLIVVNISFIYIKNTGSEK